MRIDSIRFKNINDIKDLPIDTFDGTFAIKETTR